MKKQKIRIPIKDLTFKRAGSDFLGLAWSAHVKGYDFVIGQTYTIVREDKTTYDVVPASTRKGLTLIIEADMAPAYI